MPKYSLLFLFFTCTLQSCWIFIDKPPKPDTSNALPRFTESPLISPLNTDLLDEASGIEDSYQFPGHLWVHEDNGSRSNFIYLLSHQGIYLDRFELPVPIRDWEDIAIGPGPETDKNYIYLGEIGDNLEQYSEYTIYRFEEPSSLQQPIRTVDTISFTYDDGKSYDAETLLLNPTTKDLYIITKRQFNVRVYKLAYPQSTTSRNTATFLFTLSYPFLTGGDISKDGKEILLKNYDAIYYWKVKTGETIEQALRRPRDIAPFYMREKQGEAICFDKEQNGFFSLSERGGAPERASLFYYQKIPIP